MHSAAVLLVALITTTAAYAEDPPMFTADEIKWMHEHPVVRYAIDPYWPVEYVEGGEHRGLTRDYLDQIARISGLEFKRVPTKSWNETLAFIAEGRLDLTTAVTRNLLDKNDYKNLLMSDSYFVGATIIVTRSGDSVMFTPQKLDGKTVAVKGGGAYELYLRKHYPNVKLLLINDSEQALKALAAGRVDAVVGLDVVLQPIITRKFLDTLYLAGVLADMPVISVMGVNPTLPELVSIIDKSLARIDIEQSHSMSMVDRWLANTHYGAPSWAAVLRYYSIEISALLISLVAITLLAGGALLAQRKAKRSEASKSAFLAMMSHEIRTPMNGVISSIELLQNTPLTQPQQELATLASVSARNLLEMLDDVLDVTKLEANKITIETLPTNIHTLAQGLADIYRLGAAKNGTALSISTVGVEDILVLIDPFRIRQVISNLLSNAVKFTNNGNVKLELCFEITGPDHGRLRIRVRDTGIGIERHLQGRLFQSFVQADSSITRRYGGSGLGLSICKQLIELMGGHIYLVSLLGEGTKVSCTVPVKFERTVANPVLSIIPAITGLAVLDGPTVLAAHYQVLVVEDHPINQKTIELQLVELGYRALIVPDGAAALTAMDTFRDGIAIVLLDCHLPDMDGYELARRLRQQEQQQLLAHLPIIAISASTDDAHTLKCIESGIDGSLAKPFDLSSLSKLLELWIEPHMTVTPIQIKSSTQCSLHELFIQTGREDIACLRAAVEARHLENALHYAHRLHGSALTAAETTLAKLAGSLEAAIRDATETDKQWGLQIEEISFTLENLNVQTATDNT